MDKLKGWLRPALAPDEYPIGKPPPAALYEVRSSPDVPLAWPASTRRELYKRDMMRMESYMESLIPHYEPGRCERRRCANWDTRDAL